MNIKIEPSNDLDNRVSNSGKKNWSHFVQQIWNKRNPDLVEKWKRSTEQNKLENPTKQKHRFTSTLKLILEKRPEDFEVLANIYNLTEYPYNGSEVIGFQTEESKTYFREKCQTIHTWLRDEILNKIGLKNSSISEEEKEEAIYNFLQNGNANVNKKEEPIPIKIEEEEEEEKKEKEKTPIFEKIHQCPCAKKINVIIEKLDTILEILCASFNSEANVRK